MMDTLHKNFVLIHHQLTLCSNENENPSLAMARRQRRFPQKASLQQIDTHQSDYILPSYFILPLPTSSSPQVLPHCCLEFGTKTCDRTQGNCDISLSAQTAKRMEFVAPQ